MTQPLPVFVIAFMAAAVVAAGVVVFPFGLLFCFSATAVLLNRAAVEMRGVDTE